MLTIPEYLEALRAVCSNKDAVDALHICFPTEERMESLRDTLDLFGFDPSVGRDGLVEIHPLAEAKAAFERVGFTIYNWHYDRVSKHVIFNLNRGVHEHLSSALWLCSHPEANDAPYVKNQTEDRAELFIEEGLGWFRSTSSYGRALKGKSVKLTPQEKVVFGEEFMEL